MFLASVVISSFYLEGFEEFKLTHDDLKKCIEI